MQIHREGRLHPLPAVAAMAEEVQQLANSTSGCLIAAAMLTERGSVSLPHVVPAGLFGGGTSHLDDVDRAVLVAQLWLVIQEMEKDLAKESDCGSGHFRELVEAVRGSLVAGLKFRPMDIEASTAAGLGHSDCDLHETVVLFRPMGRQEETCDPSGDL